MKERVKRNFSLSAENYDRLAELQLIAGQRLLRRLELLKEPFPFLDVGAGTGKLTPQKGVCLDIAPKMAKECRKRGRQAVCGDAEILPFKENSFKTVASNFALQWTDLDRSFKEAKRVLREKGYFLLSIPVEGSLKTLFECWRRVGSSLPLFKFPKEEEVFKKFSSLFQVIEFERLILKREFRSPREAVKAVTGVGAKNPFGRPKKGELLKFLEIYSKEPIVEYRVLIISGRKV